MSFTSLTRNVHAILSFYNEKSELVDISRAIESISVKQVTCSNNILKMGEFCQNSLEFTYYSEFLDEPIAWNNKKVKLSFTEGTTDEEQEENKVDVGIFYVEEKNVETSNNGKSYKVTCYDLPSVMSEEFDTTQTDSSVANIVAYICKISGLSFTSGTTFSLDKIESVEEGITNIGMLAYIAGYDGKNIRTNGNGELETYWYYSNSDSTHFKGQIPRSLQYLGEFTNKCVSAPLNAITSGYSQSGNSDDSSIISVGSGKSLTYTNPYITKEKLETILEDVKGFNYSVGSIKWKCDPSIRCGDTVQAETEKGEYVLFPILEQTFTYDGGLVATVTSHTYESENTVMGSSSPTDKKIQQAYNGLTKEFQRQTGIVDTNLKAGYYRLLQDENTKYPYGWLIADSEEITDTTKGWRWTQGGLIYSQDGFKTASNIAITMDGAISANVITTGTMSVERIAVMGSGGETMRITSDSQGAVFDGTGWFKVKAVGGFDISNFADKDKTLYRNRLFTITTDTEQSVVLYNYKIGQENKMANWCWATSNSNRSRIGLQNYSNDADDTGVDNWIYLTGDVATGERSIVMGNGKNNVSTNKVILNTISSKNAMNLINYQYGTTTYANNLRMYYNSSSDYGLQIRNYDSSGATKGRLEFYGNSSWNVILAGGDYTNNDVWIGMKNDVINLGKGSAVLAAFTSSVISLGNYMTCNSSGITFGNYPIYASNGRSESNGAYYRGKVPIVRSNSGNSAVEFYYDSGTDKMFVYYDGVLKHFG